MATSNYFTIEKHTAFHETNLYIHISINMYTFNNKYLPKFRIMLKNLGKLPIISQDTSIHESTTQITRQYQHYKTYHEMFYFL